MTELGTGGGGSGAGTGRDAAGESGEVVGRGRARHRPSPDTRARIQEVALELFAAQGYDKTSLREISDRLGVTKAALYYHFKSKEEIVAATVEDFLSDIDGLVAWGRGQDRTEETKREILHRYADIVRRRFTSMRFFQQNPTGPHKSALGEQFRERMGALHSLVFDEGGTPKQRIRALLAVVGMHMGMAIFDDEDGPSEDERMQAALDVAYELIGGPA
jgi:AcrR family transcriptional regulator